MERKSCSGNSCDKNKCLNLNHPKVIKNYINSNVQYIADFYNSITVNPWGIISIIENPNKKSHCKNVYWVANNGSNKLGKYFHNGELLEEVDTIGSPTGLVYNYTNFFGQFKLITVTLAGTIEGLRIDNNNNPAGSTELIKENDSGVYTGVDITKKNLYVANFASGKVEMYDINFIKIREFTDDALVASGYCPYNVAVKDKYVYVTFARKVSENSAVPGIGFGYVDKFSIEGELLYRHISRDPLNAPWGLEFSECGKYLYVGNNGDGKINIFDSCTGEFIGPLMDKNCNPIQIGNLWGISLLSDRLSFASGMDDGQNGLIGYLQML